MLSVRLAESEVHLIESGGTAIRKVLTRKNSTSSNDRWREFELIKTMEAETIQKARDR